MEYISAIHEQEANSRLLYFISSIIDWIGWFFRSIFYGIGLAWRSIQYLPDFFSILVYVIFAFVYIQIVAIHVTSILRFRREWSKRPKSNLMYGYFLGSGQYQAKKIYLNAHTMIRDSDYIGISGVAYLLGNISHKSLFIMYVISFIYIPLAIIGFFEILLRISLGTVYYIVIKGIHKILLFLGGCISWGCIPLIKAIDKIMRKSQKCPHCYDVYNGNEKTLPIFICPNCKGRHKNLFPSSSGVFYARCACVMKSSCDICESSINDKNDMKQRKSKIQSFLAFAGIDVIQIKATCKCKKQFIPVTILTGRSQYTCLCPNNKAKCNEPLFAANANQAFIHLIGGANSGKTRYLSAFQALYCKQTEIKQQVFTQRFPSYRKFHMDVAYYYSSSSISEEKHLKSLFIPSGKVIPFSILHKYKSKASTPKDNLIIFDINGKTITNNLYTNNPRHFRFCNGFILFFDLSSQSGVANTKTIINQFSVKLDQIKGKTQGRHNEPLAIIVSKADMVVMHPLRNLMDERFTLSARSNMLRKSLEDEMGISDIVSDIDRCFSNVAYFAVSSLREDTKKHRDIIISPVKWILGEAKIPKKMKKRMLTLL